MSFVLAILWVIFAALLCWQLLRWLPAGMDKYNPLPYIIALLPLSTYVVGALLFFSIFATEWQVLYASNNPQSYNFAQSYAYLCIAYAVLFLISLKSYTPYWFGRLRRLRKLQKLLREQLETPENFPANVPQNHQNDNKLQEFSGKCSTKPPKQQQTPEILPQMFHKTAKTTTNAGNSPANVPQNHQNNNKLQEFSGKCSKKRLKQQQTPEILPQMFQKTAKTTTNAGNSPANVPQNGQNSNKRRKNQPQEIRVMTLNCRYGKASAHQIIEIAKKYHVNTLLLQELSESLVKNLKKLGISEIFPTLCVGAQSEHNNGGFNAIFTQYSAISTCDNAVKIEAASIPSVTTHLTSPAQTQQISVKFASAHPKSPMRGCEAWSEGIRALSNIADRSTESTDFSTIPTLTILTGDLNSTIDHPSFRTLLKAGFTDTGISLGKRLQTWPTWLKWPNLTLDHVLFCAKNCRAQAVWQQTEVIDGTDHLAYLAEIDIYPLKPLSTKTSIH